MTTNLVGPPTNTEADTRDEIRGQLLELLWRQWSALGVRGRLSKMETRVVDPEALLLLTLAIGRFDPRLSDAVLAWLELNGDFLNVQRLRNLARRADPVTQAALSAIAERLGRRNEVAPKWRGLASSFRLEEPTPYFRLRNGCPRPLCGDPDEIFLRHGLLRPQVRQRLLARRFPSAGAPALLLRLRALLGLSIRCEVLCLLGARTEVHPTEAARLVGQSIRGTQNLLVEMVRSGCVQTLACGRERTYGLRPGPLDALLKPDGAPTPWVNAVPLYQALATGWRGLEGPHVWAPDESACAQARRIRTLLSDAGPGR
jgi:hypothetical protein